MCTPPQQGPCVPGGPVLSLPLPLAPGRAVGNLLRPRCDPRVTGPSLTGWDGPSCTEDVSVSRGQCAVLSCSISNPLLNVTIHLKTPGKDFQPLFSVTPPGCFRQGGWQLQVRGGMAQLVIPEVSDTQAGWYRWHLQGLQRNVKNTTLNVSGTEAPDLNQAGNTSSACSCGLQRACSSGAAGQFQLVLVIVTVMLILLATTLLAWHQRHSPLYSKPPQV
uniref:Secreted and transmembrane 1 n=1 Tax=Suricata suricatta TaxID=37032 RepID=A0A673VLR8_SURSU